MPEASQQTQPFQFHQKAQLQSKNNMSPPEMMGGRGDGRSGDRCGRRCLSDRGCRGGRSQGGELAAWQEAWGRGNRGGASRVFDVQFLKKGFKEMWLSGEVEESFCHLFVFVSGVGGWRLKESQDLYHHCDYIIIIMHCQLI